MKMLKTTTFLAIESVLQKKATRMQDFRFGGGR